MPEPSPRRLILLTLTVLTTAPSSRADDPVSGVEAALAREIIGPRLAQAETQEFCALRVARMPEVATPEQWTAQIEAYRRQVLPKVVLRGEAAAWNDAPSRVEWLETIEGGPGYTIRKLRYEAMPGLWIPALLYEPEKLSSKVPVVLNVNGHEAVGKSADYKQIRCINLAKRGMLALNVEWFGMGQFRTPRFRHSLINTIDLCGTSGIALHYLMLKRGIDVLLGHDSADPARVAVTGLSGGGWQTIFISGLDPRVTLADPVAGYSSFLTRVREFEDLGDSEQTPCDLGLFVDYTHLTAMRAPRPTLLTFNAKDDCCFAAGHALPPLVDAARPIYSLYGAEDKLRTHVNEDPGTHNYGLDNRLAFYAMLADHFYAGDTSFAREELPYEGEVKTAEELNVALPESNLDFAGVAERLAAALPRQKELPREKSELERWQADARLRLRGIVRPFDPHTTVQEIESREESGLKTTWWKLKVGAAWTVPVVELQRGDPRGTTLLLADEGRKSVSSRVDALLKEHQRVVVIDPFLIGESKVASHEYLFALLVATVGERPLGVQAGQVMAAARWLAQRTGGQPVTLENVGRRSSVIGLVAAALEPTAVRGLVLRKPMGSLRELVDQLAEYDDSPELFCFGLLEGFDLWQIAALVAPRDVTIEEADPRATSEYAKLNEIRQALQSDANRGTGDK
jgi:hypothetical protein